MSTWPDNLVLGPIREWPGTRTAAPRRSAFKASLTATLILLRDELWHLSGTDEQLLMAMRPEDFRLDGRPRANAQPEHQGIILTVTTKHGHLSWPCDTFDRWQDNLRAIALALEALRKVDRYGVTARGEQYRGFLALEQAADKLSSHGSARIIIEAAGIPGLSLDDVLEDAPAERLRALRAAKRRTHPDTRGAALSWTKLPTFEQVMAAELHLRQHGWTV
jgi:hypothetical protein